MENFLKVKMIKIFFSIEYGELEGMVFIMFEEDIGKMGNSYFIILNNFIWKCMLLLVGLLLFVMFIWFLVLFKWVLWFMFDLYNLGVSKGFYFVL